MRKHIIVHGRVQSVGFRSAAIKNGVRQNIKGWVCNKPDGTVEAEIEGESNDINKYMDKLKAGFHPLIRVDYVWERDFAQDKGYDSFTMR